jgi:3-oxoacyl-(acyl-carrier-protein) synthase
MRKNIFINGASAISPQHTFEQTELLTQPIEYDSNYILAIDPEYKNYINPVQIRRMSRILKMTITAAKSTMAAAGIDCPDAIITGSGYGCIDDTEKFLINMLDNQEAMLNPTAFMQSTHNSVGGLVALNMKCMAYNFTYVHRGFSFESALLDAMMLLHEDKQSVLIGGFDENSANHVLVTNKLNFWKPNPIKSFELLDRKSEGSISGEGANFMLLATERNEHTYGEVMDVQMMYKPTEAHLFNALQTFLAKHAIEASEIDLFLTGLNGDEETDRIYYRMGELLMLQPSMAWFKHLCGEYYTAGAFGLWLAANILKTQAVPEIIMVNKVSPVPPIKYILIYNHYQQINHCFYLLKA